MAGVSGDGGPESLVRKINHFRTSAPIALSTDELFRDASQLAVMNGQGIRPDDCSPVIEGYSNDDHMAHLEAVQAAIRKSYSVIAPLKRQARREMAGALLRP